MLGAGNLTPPSAPPRALQKRAMSSCLLFNHHTHKANLHLLPQSLSNYYTSLSLSLSGRSGFCLFAQNKVKNPAYGGVNLEQSQNFEGEFEFGDDDDEEDYEFDDEDDDDDDEDGGGELMVPLEKINDWVERKPKGFGEGKVYDTSYEDKLLEEIEQSFKAQVANIEKLKKEAKKPKSNIELQEDLFSASEGVPGGIRVRINHLPKKKNIHRDLKSAFEGVPGIINISPVNSGNKKTKDPVCKGLAFVDFKSLKDANRFIQMFSGQIVSFGKSGKPIKCEILKPLDSSYEGLAFDGYNSISDGSSTFLEDEEDEDDHDMEVNDSVDDDYEELVEGPDGKFVLGSSDKLSAKDRIERIEMLESKLLARAVLYEKEMKSMKEKPEDIKAFKGKSEVKNKQDQKPNLKTDKKPNAKSDKKPKPSFSGSSRKLKGREKAKLEDVFSRYGSRGAKASKDR